MATSSQTPESLPAPASSRLVSLDALRGFDMAWILGADSIVISLAAVVPLLPLQFLAVQMQHKSWEGFAFYDLIFPLFIFVAGVSIALAIPAIIRREGRAAACRRILTRGIVLFLLGIFANGGLAQEWPDIRLFGVLQRIALAYTAAALAFCFLGPRRLAGLCAALLIGYWALLAWIPIPNVPLTRAAMEERYDAPAPSTLDNSAALRAWRMRHEAEVAVALSAEPESVTGSYQPGLNVANYIDFKYLPGRRYFDYWDPEGLLSTLPAIATCLLGVCAGLQLTRRDVDPRRQPILIAAAGATLLGLGWLWDFQFPVIKNIWTSSFVLVAGGWSLLLLALFYHLVEVQGWRRWCQPLVWLGMNPILLYLSTGLLDYASIGIRVAGGDIHRTLDESLGPGTGRLFLHVVMFAAALALARFLHGRRIFLRV